MSNTSLVTALLAGVCLVCLNAVPAQAAGGGSTWNGSQSSDWFDENNWDGDKLPGSGDDVQINQKPDAIISGAGSAETAQVIIGDGAADEGKLVVDGIGSTLTMDDNKQLVIGSSGSGEMIIRNGGRVSTQGSSQIAVQPDSAGAVTVRDAGSAWTIRDELSLGFLKNPGTRNATLTILSGGLVDAGAVIIGRSESDSSARVEGPNSALISQDNLVLGDEGDGRLIIAKGGRVTVGDGKQIDIAIHATGSGTLIIGDEDGKAPAAPGTVEADGITFGDGDGALVFNHTGSGYVFAPDIMGDGAITVLAGDTNLTGDASGFTGTTTVSGGALRVNGILRGTLDVADGGVLGGAGTVGATTVLAGGVLSPSNSPGTLTIDGDLTLNAGAIYEVEFGDLIVVTGDATLGGEVRVVDGAWQPLIDYTILTATGFAGTEFDSVSSGFTFLDPALRYTDTDVILRLERNDVSFARVAATPNQRNVAGGLDNLSFGNALHDAVVTLDAAGARKAFRQLSGDVHGSAAAARINESGNLRTIVSRRFRSAFDDRRAQTRFPLASYASLSGTGDDHPHTSNHDVWGQAFGSWGRIGGDGNAAGLRHDQGGFLAGIDTMPADDWRVSIFAGYSRSRFSVSERASSGSSDNFHLGVHGGTEIGALRLNAGAAHAWHDISTRRTVAFQGFTDRLSASYRGRTMQVFGEAGYRFGTDAFSFEPFLGAAHVHTSTNRFTETGGAAALTAQRATTAATFSTLGLRASSEFSLGAMDVTARAMVGWRHAFGDTTPVTRVSFTGGDAFTVTGTPLARNMAVVEAGLDLGMSEAATLNFSYDGAFSRPTQRHGFNARLQVAF